MPYKYSKGRDGRQWRRYSGDDPIPVFCVDDTDISPVHVVYPSGYDENCSCCWFGFPHTEDYHNQSVKRGKASN
jgi:hypothetical protein